MKKKIDRRRLGFTMIELMVVISILGILFAILVPNLIRSRFNAYQSGCEENEHALQVAMESYGVDQQGFPPSLNNLQSGGYISVLPSCPSMPGSTYNTTYEWASNFKMYTISCPGVHYLQLPGAVRQGYPQCTAQGTLVTN
jgi:prepilin-type N-terminal cleavage/methylation domain-containing protein